MKLIVITQDHEWYGNDEGTEGRWKAKGGSFIEVGSFETISHVDVAAHVEKVRPLVETNNSGFRSAIIDWMIISDEELTEDEKLEVEYEGKVRYGRYYLHGDTVRSGAWYRSNVLKKV